ncbi:MAG: transcription antitermination protein NusB [Bacteroidales bacterium]|nr:transcription antitermination protein NusB [Bacteroidales bacterium]
MISRRLLRIKALLILYAFNRRAGDNLDDAERELMLAINKTYDLYHYLFLLLLEVVDIASEKIEIARQKKIPSYEDLNPNRRFVDNPVISQIEKNKALNKYRLNSKFSWSVLPELPKKLYIELLNWEPYQVYMKSQDTGYIKSKKFLSKLFTELICTSEELHSSLEEMSIYWNDDIEFVAIMIEKTIRRLKENSGPLHPLMDMFKTADDETFVKLLLRKAVINSEKYLDLIGRNATNWEIDRVVLMDTLVMQLAITEIVEFPEIPVKVTLNEYIEITKFYCTAKSSTFVNGILDKVVREMRDNSMFRKQGRGLIGEPGLKKS